MKGIEERIANLIKNESDILELQHRKRMITRELLEEVIKKREFSLLKLDTHKIRRDYWNSRRETEIK